MPFYNGEKWACYSCTKGHRSSKCQHVDRILYKVRKPGRPLNNCPHTLPETIQPGSFINTLAESMAHGHPPNEAGRCKCAGEMVEVAIPKVKNCSCITVSDAAAAGNQPPLVLPSKNGASTNGVKSGRVTKQKTQTRRRKSIINGDAVEEAISNGSTNSEPSSTPKFEVADSPIGIPAPYNAHGRMTPQHPYRNGVSAGDQFQASPAIAPPGMMPNSVPMMVFQQQFLQSTPENQQLQFLAEQQGKQTLEQMATSPLHAPTGFFQEYPKPSIPNSFTNGHQTPSFQQSTMPAPNRMNDDRVFVSLTHYEYMWIQSARAVGIDFSQLPKFDSPAFPKIHQAQSHPQHAISVPQHQQQPPASSQSPYTFSSTSTSETPSTPSLQKGSFPTPAPASCCSSNSAAPSPDIDRSTDPSSPRCKCGDACRCVPCAEHPKNPVQIERIRGELNLLYSTSSVPSPPGPSVPKKSCCGSKSSSDQAQQPTSPTFDRGEQYGDKESPGISDGGMGIGDGGDGMADFSNFVLFNYSYGGGGCMEGQGGCMCGEGCTCVGCLTHGGHDGVELEMLAPPPPEQQQTEGNGQTNGAGGDGDGAGNRSGGGSGGGCCGSKKVSSPPGAITETVAASN